ncbi:Cas9 inhibitor AcrIIA9 family protein [Anaerotignum sp. MB30-C6]|uniref:Cas9 inhibitor AcrIIA9 family protein n=1 Tax=Anaerotignum sp. MB30-C6 TaxID=3070814 RepID=UPI0027DDF864|nr:Cas9 inhibitor AcrIIA9 family protein [Anaerotignum sp. MB30-C6]WMI81574.1 Cas9 inhibitor AcrIIA9 family protein [Anaerotignum sp. MB30-C6]
MIQKAIEKINAEVQKAPNDVYRAKVGEYIIDHILTDKDAEKVLDEGKTLEKAMTDVQEKALKEAQGDAMVKKAVIEQTEVFGWAMKYFGLQDVESINPKTAAEKPKGKTAEKALSLSLDDFF